MRSTCNRIFCTLLLSNSVYAAPRNNARPTVTISDGIVVGTATGVTNQPSNTALVNSYLGIPFADSPPVRFAGPTPPKKWNKPLHAQKLPPACLQSFLSGELGQKERAYFNNPGLPEPAESEDCLYLNVFAPQNASPKNLKPVMFWIFGGNLAFGTASLAYYNGSYLAANEDVVVVAANYRTNMFGFSQSPELPAGQTNAGYLDQRFALQWVQKNIARFGGDPSKVTLFGESAGGYSIRDILAQPPNPLPFRAAIMESEGLVALDEDAYDQVSFHFGCSQTPSPLACLRKVDGRAIQDFIYQSSLSFGPVEDNTHLRNVLPSIQSGKFAKVPILMGTNKDEGRVFADIIGANSLNASLEQAIDFLKTAGIDLTPVKNLIPQQYQNAGIDAGYFLVSQVITDTVFTCRTNALSQAISNVGQTPVWRYRYDASFPSVSPFPQAGAYHSVEIPSVWGTYPIDSPFGETPPEQIALSKYTAGVWANFAKNPTQGPGWPRLGSAGGRELALLGGKGNSTGEETVPLITADYPCALYRPVLEAAQFAY